MSEGVPNKDPVLALELEAVRIGRLYHVSPTTVMSWSTEDYRLDQQYDYLQVWRKYNAPKDKGVTK